MIQARAVARRQGHSLGLAKSLPRRARPTRCEGRRVRGGWRAYGCGKQGGDDEREAGRMDFAAGEMRLSCVVRKACLLAAQNLKRCAEVTFSEHIIL